MSLSASTTLAPTLEHRLPEKQDRFRNWKQLGRFLLMVLVVALVAMHVHFADIARAFAKMRPGYVVTVIFILSPLAALLRSMRWRYLLPEGNRVPLVAYVGAYLVGVLGNALPLGKVGDLVKARMVCGTHLDYGRSLGVVVIDRLLEGLALLLIFSAVLFVAPLPAWTHHLAWLAGFGSLGILASLRLLFHRRERLLALVARRLPAGFGERSVRLIGRLLAGCQALSDPRRVLGVVVFGIGVWAVEIATVRVFLLALSVPAPWFIAAPVLLAVLNFGMLIPISPGSVGVYQWLCVFALSIWGVDRQLGLALGVVMQTVLFVPLYLCGAVWLLSLGWRKNSKTVYPDAAV